MAFKLCMAVDLCMTYNYAYARVEDLDLDARSQWVGSGKKNLDKKSINLDATVGHFLK